MFEFRFGLEVTKFEQQKIVMLYVSIRFYLRYKSTIFTKDYRDIRESGRRRSLSYSHKV